MYNIVSAQLSLWAAAHSILNNDTPGAAAPAYLRDIQHWCHVNELCKAHMVQGALRMASLVNCFGMGVACLPAGWLGIV